VIVPHGGRATRFREVGSVIPPADLRATHQQENSPWKPSWSQGLRFANCLCALRNYRFVRRTSPSNPARARPPRTNAVGSGTDCRLFPARPAV
jgi:hypothetical protein